MSGYVGRNERQRELEKLYNRLCSRYSRFEVWQDMVVLIACAIANAADKRHFEEREKMYMRAIQKYTKEEQNIFPDFFTHIVLGMEENPDCDFLGELYMGLELGNNKAGQFFTPYDICRAMAQCTINEDMLKSQIEKNGWISINDPASGAGATLVAAANYLKSVGINYQMQALFVAQDIDMTVALMCYIQLSLLGCAGYVIIGNTLTEPATGNVLFGEESSRCWYTPMFFHDVWNTRRAIAIAKMMFQRVATAFPAAATDQATASMPSDEKPKGAHFNPTRTNPSDPFVPALTMCADKKHAGQLMWTLEGE